MLTSIREGIEAWGVQRRVLGALLLREVLTRFGRRNLGFLWIFVEPMMFTLGVTAMWNFMKATHGSNLPITAFAVTGYSSVLLWRNMPARCIHALQPNQALLYHRHVRIIDIFLARLLLEAGGATTSFILLASFFTFIGWIDLPEDILQVFSGWLMLAWFGASSAITLGILSEEYELVDKLWHPASYLLFPLSGAAFLVDALPAEGQKYILALPMVHGLEYLREGYFGSKIHAHYDLGYMAAINSCLTLIGLLAVKKIGPRITPG
ncbi:ABC transporter permease [Sphingobium yanoikuyae]|uniref:ABC transporter permease n=1 Tax=Sphingobium yanoikuyae TaxID=13690 RepID=UPI0028B1F404|nr:ABC transporter permease [Sphingobium yanoikuyae]